MNGQEQMANGRDGQLMRRGEVLRMSGWSRTLLEKLVETGGLHVCRPVAGGQRYFYRQEVRRLMEPAETTEAQGHRA